MKNIRDTCIEFLKSEDIRREVKEIIRPMFQLIYNETYVYLWFICFYHVFLIFIILANLILLLRLLPYIMRNNTVGIFPTPGQLFVHAKMD